MSPRRGTPRIHLWVYNHPLIGVSDQITFLRMILQQQGYVMTLGRRPRLDALNIVIENFSETTSQILIDFCEQTGKRVALVMTEHLDLLGSELYIHGEPLWTYNDYMHPATQISRIKNLMDCATFFSAIFVLGDLPQLHDSERMFPGLPVRNLPFPVVPHSQAPAQPPQHDFVFTGAITAFREQILSDLSAYSLAHLPQLLSRKRRDIFNTSARIALNIPQRPGWRWLSLMRIIAALLCGRATVSIATNDNSYISRCCRQLDEHEWKGQITSILSNWQCEYDSAWHNYDSMRLEFLELVNFPADIFEYWALLEGIASGSNGASCSH